MELDRCCDCCHRLSDAADDARTLVSYSRFTGISSKLLTEAKEYVAQAKRDLVEMVWRGMTTPGSVVLNPTKRPRAPQMPPMDATGIEALLARGTTLFVCKNCPVLGTKMDGITKCMSARAVCAHWREFHPGLQWNDGWPYEDFFDRRKSVNRWPKRLPFVDAYLEATSVGEAVVEMGLNENTSHEELDTLVRAGRLICMCGSPRLQVSSTEVLSWDKLVHKLIFSPVRSRYNVNIRLQISHVKEEEAWASKWKYTL